MVFQTSCLRVRKVFSLWNQLGKQQVPELNRAGVIIRDATHVHQLIHTLQSGGANTLQVVSDFDMTLSKFSHNGQRCPTTHNLLHSSCLITEECKHKMRALQERFYPVEIDTAMSLEEKIPLMVEWWSDAHDLLVQQEIQRKLLANAVSQSEAKLRDGYALFFSTLERCGVPLLIFSAGVGDIVEEILKHHHLLTHTVSIQANYMTFNKEGVLEGFVEPLIHSFNKGAGHCLSPAHISRSHDRPYVLLLGDSLGDVSMANQLPGVQKVLKIGYLNDQVEARRPAYVSTYDIVLERDETLDVPNAILRHISMATHL
ncbi:7-methylguanosine phosphate-specific 5'-nucleotidase-like [Engraulis encrasicolus]|uniref:7-methylguanosine phosphate-specific 5'-nucleotidase-like n=1 Tax=Engraulis encrasicolus TaxID=184585 RepID=UPI002FD6C0D3